MTDIHSHILYGLDDGARDAEESRRMLAAASGMGVTHIIATPHVRHADFDLDRAYRRHEEVQAMAEPFGIRVDLGFELHWNALVSLEETAARGFSFQDTDHILLEFSLSAPELPLEHDQAIYRLQRAGLNVIIAHPERYRFVQRRSSTVERWRDMGCELQLDAICLLRAYEPRSKSTARRLYKAGMYDYLASDAHCAEDYVRFDKALKWAQRHE